MRRVFIVARREYLAMVATKGFLIGVLLVPLLMAASGFVPWLLQRNVDLGDKRIVVLDRSQQVFAPLETAVAARNEHAIRDSATGRQTASKYVLERGPAGAVDDQARLELSNRVRAGEIYGFIEIPEDTLRPGGGRPLFYSDSSALSDVRQWLERTIAQIVRNERFRTAGVDAEVVAAATVPVPVEGLMLFVRGPAGEAQAAAPVDKIAAVMLPSGVMMLMFMIIFIAFQPMLECVLEEKQHRIAEVLLGSVDCLQLMTGKLLGNVAGSLTTISIYFAFGALLAWHFEVLDRVPWHIVPWFIVFQVLAVLFYSTLVMALAAAASNLQEAQGYLIFVWGPLMLPMFAWLNIVREPNGAFATWFSMIPPVTPMLMVLRMAATTVPAWQPFVGVALVLATTLLALVAAFGVFRIGLLAQGHAQSPSN